MREDVYFNLGDVFVLLIRALTSWPDLCWTWDTRVLFFCLWSTKWRSVVVVRPIAAGWVIWLLSKHFTWCWKTFSLCSLGLLCPISVCSVLKWHREKKLRFLVKIDSRPASATIVPISYYISLVHLHTFLRLWFPLIRFSSHQSANRSTHPPQSKPMPIREQILKTEPIGLKFKHLIWILNLLVLLTH